jgi:NlpC/P60 family putative phage cell wall peptidase
MSALIAEARGWIGTPFHDGAGLKGVGADCVGFLAAICAPALPADWPVPATRDPALWLGAVQGLLPALPLGTLAPPALLVFAPEGSGAARHAGLLISPDRFLHAHWRAGVAEQTLTPWWRARLIAAFAVPEL